MSPPHAQPTPEPAPRPVERSTMDEALPASPVATPAPEEVAAAGGAAAIERPADPLVGTTIDERYRIIAPIAEGGMGRVYRAHHRTANRTVAIKVLSGDCDPAAKDVREARFVREARVISGLAHPNVVQVYDFGVLPNGELYYVMEFIAGRPLADLVFDEAPMPVARVTRLALQMAAGLQAAHEQGIVHRDLKPENVIVVEQNGEQIAKVVDFGIAKILGDTAAKKLTRTGIVTGTPHYISPEQARAGALDTRSDIYSFGVMLYEMAVGQLPFDVDDESWVALLEAHIRQPPPPPSSRGVDVGPLEGIILRCLEKEPARRFQSMAALAAALERPQSAPAYTPAPYEVTPGGPPHARPSAVAAPPSLPTRKTGFFAVVALLALALGAGVWWITSLLRSPEPSSTALPAPAAPSDDRRELPVGEVAPISEGPVVHLVSEPPGAEVTVDGAFIGNTPLDVRLPTEGAQVLGLALPGHLPLERTLEPDTPAAWTLTLRERPAPRRARGTPSMAPATSETPATSESVTAGPQLRIEEPINPWAD